MAGRDPSRASFIYDPRVRSIAIQALLVIAIVLFFAWVAGNAIDNLRRANIVSGFGFLDERAGFEISQSFIPYSVESTYARALLVGLVNTLVVAVIGIILATVLGFIVGIARLSGNWLIARIATVYVETFRNVPVLLQLLFWYRAVLAVLPGPRQGYELPLGVNLNIRGLFLPRPVFGGALVETLIALAIAVVALIVLAVWARRRRDATGTQFPAFRIGLAILVGLPLLVFFITGAALSFDYPRLKGFNFTGGMHVKPEIMALTLGLVIYTATFIAEVVRAGILAVDRGQTEAAAAVGLRRGQVLRLVVVPQALRVMIPPLTNQYLNLTKNSSLAVAVGYPDLVSIFAGTVLNQTGQAIEAVTITMLVYLAISLATSLLMNRFNRRVSLVER